MKIVFFISGLNAGGKERRLVELLKALKNNPDIQFELIVMDKNIHYNEVLDLMINIHFFLRKSKKDFTIFKLLYKYCKKYKPDILHCWDSMTAVYSAPICKLLKIKLINGMVIDTPEKRTIFNRTYRRAKLTFPFSDIIIGNSKAGLAAYHAQEKKSVCIPNGFDFERLKQLESVEKLRQQLGIKTKYIIGMVASFSKYKDYITFFKAAEMLLEKRNDITFLAIGSNTDLTPLKEIVNEKCYEYIMLLGKRSNVESLINVMDICVLSTFTEGISNSILEYMALGKPVIATEGGGTKEIVLNEVTGFLIERTNPQELTNKIEILLNSASLRSKMGISGKERIQNYFSINKMVDSYISLYKILDPKKKLGH